jgi:predicted ester cyclase
VLNKSILMLGVHTSESMGIPPTGKRVYVRLAAFNKIIERKIVETEVFMDVASLLVQLGVMPPPKGN